MAGVDSMIALQDFLHTNDLMDERKVFAKITVTKKGKLIENSNRTVFIWKNSYGGWIIQPDELRFVVGHERFNTEYQDMYVDGNTLTVYSDGCKISISV